LRALFFINETAYVNIATIQKTKTQQQKLLPILIINNVKSIVEQQQQFINLLRDKSKSKYQKIKDIEVEENEEISKAIAKNKSNKTQVIKNQQEIFKALVNFYKNSNEIKFCALVEYKINK